MEKLLKGNAVVAAIKEDILAEVAQLKAQGVEPMMAIVRCGARGDDIAYENSAKKRFAGLEIGLKVVELPEDIGQNDFVQELHKLNEDKSIQRRFGLSSFTKTDRRKYYKVSFGFSQGCRLHDAN